ncbi:MAG: hypothetical protein WCD79_19340 [Chthoniobacteraceae bacterium]
MTSAAYSSHPTLAVTADVLLPVLGVLTILLPALAWRAGRLRNPGVLWACGVVSIALVYILRSVNVKTGVLMTLCGARYSSHTAVAISFAVTLVAFRLSLLPAIALAICGYLWVITYLGYHAPIDALCTLAVILPLSVVCHVPWWRKAKKTR